MHPIRKRAAFTLVEVSLAITIAAVALLAIVSMIPLSYDANRKAVNATRYAQLAQDILAAVQADAAMCRDRLAFKDRYGSGSGFTLPVSSSSEWKSPVPSFTVNGKSAMIFKPATGTDLVSHELTCEVITGPADTYAGSYVCRVQVKIWPGVGPDVEKLKPHELTRLLTSKDLSNAP